MVQLNSKNPLQYPVNTEDPIRKFAYPRPPTAADYKNYKRGDEWLDTVAREWWKMVYKDSTMGQWEGMAGTGATETLTTNDAVIVPPDAAENINVLGTATNGIRTIGSIALNTVTIGMNSPYADGNFIFENNAAATLRYVAIENNDTDVGSYSCLALTSQDTGGDAFTLFTIDPATMYMALGIDNDDGDRFKLVNNTTPSGGNEIFMVDTALDSFWHYSGQLFQSNAWAGGTVFTRIQNTDNTNVASHACLEILPGGIGGGDPYIQWQVGAVVQQFSFGIDNSNNDILKLTDGDNPSLGNTIFSVDPTAANAITFNNVYEFPIADGAAHQILITDGAGNLDWGDLGGGFIYEEITTATHTIENHHSYGANRAGGVVFTLPATAAIGTAFQILGILGIYSITQGAGQYIRYGNMVTTVGAGGSITSALGPGDCLTCKCIVADTGWIMYATQGNFVIV